MVVASANPFGAAAVIVWGLSMAVGAITTANACTNGDRMGCSIGVVGLAFGGMGKIAQVAGKPLNAELKILKPQLQTQRWSPQTPQIIRRVEKVEAQASWLKLVDGVSTGVSVFTAVCLVLRAVHTSFCP